MMPLHVRAYRGDRAHRGDADRPPAGYPGLMALHGAVVGGVSTTDGQARPRRADEPGPGLTIRAGNAKRCRVRR